MKQKYILLITLGLCVFGVIFFHSCDQKDRAFGTVYRVITIADSLDWLEIEGTVRAAFEREIYTPQLEPQLDLKKINLSELRVFERYHNIMIVGTLQSGSGIKELFESRLTPETLELVKRDSLYLFKSEDPWYQPQLLVMLIANDLETLKYRIEENQDFLFRLFDDHVQKIMTGQLFYQHKPKEAEKRLLENYGWKIKIQNEYALAEENKEHNYVWFRRVNPERWLFVNWEDTDDPSMLTEEYCLQKRSWIGEGVYNNEKVVEGYTSFNRVDFNGRYAIQVRGLWETEDKGGPFVMYVFYDEPTRRIYVIDIACYAAGKTKMQYIRELDVIAKTFQTKQDISNMQ